MIENTDVNRISVALPFLWSFFSEKGGFQHSECIYLLLRTFGTFLGGLRISYLRPGFAHNLPTNICGLQLKFKTIRLFEPIATVSTQQLCEKGRFDRFSQAETRDNDWSVDRQAYHRPFFSTYLSIPWVQHMHLISSLFSAFHPLPSPVPGG